MIASSPRGIPKGLELMVLDSAILFRTEGLQGPQIEDLLQLQLRLGMWK